MKFKCLLLVCLLGVTSYSHARDYAIGFNPRTGDAWIDAQLGDINVYTSGNIDGVIDDVVVSFGAPRSLVREYMIERHWAPGDVYYACALAYQLRRPCGETLREYEQDHSQGWGVIAKRMGIKPGSAQFHALKERVGKSNGKYKKQGKDHSGHGGGKDKNAKEKKGKGHH